MSNLKLFLKQNKIQKKNTFYPATKSLTDENGNPLEWEIRAVSTNDTEKIRESCTIEVPVTGKPGVFRPKVNSSLFASKLTAAAIVYPDLNDKELQDSYGVMTPEDLIKEMVDDPTEYNNLISFVQSYNGFDETLQEKVDEAKN